MRKNSQSQLFHEISAGGIVVRCTKKGKCAIAVIKRSDMNDWTLPKGHQERNESLQETAIREVFEETRIRAVPVLYLGSFTYFVVGRTKKGVPRRIHRTVHWFLMKYKKSRLRRLDREVERVLWVSVNEDFSFMSYKNDQAMIKKAIMKVLSWVDRFQY